MPANPVVELLEHRASCRDYRPEPLGPGTLERLVAAAQRVATDATGQMYSVVRLTDPGLRARISELIGGQEHLKSASESLVVCLDIHRLRLLLEARGDRRGIETTVALLFGITDAALFAQALALAAEAEGLGVCFLGSIQNAGLDVAELLGLPEGVVPLWGMTIGVPSLPTATKPRLPTGLVLHENRYSEPEAEALAEAYRVMAASTRSGDWLNPLRKYFAAGGIMAKREPGFRRMLARQGLGL